LGERTGVPNEFNREYRDWRLAAAKEGRRRMTYGQAQARPRKAIIGVAAGGSAAITTRAFGDEDDTSSWLNLVERFFALNHGGCNPAPTPAPVILGKIDRARGTLAAVKSGNQTLVSAH
jgi:hypothetical protein